MHYLGYLIAVGVIIGGSVMAVVESNRSFVETDLASLENGVAPPSHHVSLSDFYVIEDQAAYRTAGSGIGAGDTECVYFPIQSTEPIVNPRAKGDEIYVKESVAYAVIVQSSSQEATNNTFEYFLTVKNVKGKIVHSDTLEKEELAQMAKFFPGIQSGGYWILKEGRSPAYFWIGMVAMGVIGLVVVFLKFHLPLMNA